VGHEHLAYARGGDCGPNTQMKTIKAMTSARNGLYVVGDGSTHAFASGATVCIERKWRCNSVTRKAFFASQIRA
jgi:hypothetical protein